MTISAKSRSATQWRPRAFRAGTTSRVPSRRVFAADWK
jgi:hypothetical protein